MGLDQGRLERNIRALEAMLASVGEDVGAEQALTDAVDYLTQLGLQGYGALPVEAALRSLVQGQVFVGFDDEQEILRMVVEDHMQAGGQAFVVVSGDRAGETGYADEDEQLDMPVKVVDVRIKRG